MARYTKEQRSQVADLAFAGAMESLYDAACYANSYVVNGERCPSNGLTLGQVRKYVDLLTDDEISAYLSIGDIDLNDDGTNGQDRESYSDDQDRDCYSVD